jgi:hypothetical protein
MKAGEMGVGEEMGRDEKRVEATRRRENRDVNIRRRVETQRTRRDGDKTYLLMRKEFVTTSTGAPAMVWMSWWVVS